MAPFTFCSVTAEEFLLKCAVLIFFPESGLKVSLHKPFHQKPDFSVLLIKAGLRLELSIWKISLVVDNFFFLFSFKF